MFQKDLSSDHRVVAIARFAVTTALLTAVLEIVVRWGSVLVLHRLQIIEPDIIWIAPLTSLASFGVVAIPLVLVQAMLPAWRVDWVAAAVFTFLCAFLVLLRVPDLHEYASLALAAGIGWRLFHVCRDRPVPVCSWLNRTAVGLAIGSAVAIVTELWLTSGTPWNASRTPNGDHRAPNVLLIVLDTVGAEHLSLYGYPRATSPNLSRLAGDAIVFDNAIAPSSWTLPSHASMFTGIPAARLSTRWFVPLDRTYPTLAERFRAAGYRTAGFTGNTLYTGSATGLTRGFDYYRSERRGPKEVFAHTSLAQTQLLVDVRYASSFADLFKAFSPPHFAIPFEPPHPPKTAEHVVGEFLDWQRDVEGSPFFAFVNLYDAHEPYRSPDPFARMFPSDGTNRARYDGAIAYLDGKVAVILAALSQRGVLDRTIVIITADHGEAFGEHGLFGHGTSLYRELIHVPLLVAAHGIAPGGRRISEVVSLTDLAATTLDLAGVPQPWNVGGSSFADQSRSGVFKPRIALSWVERRWSAPARTADGDLAAAIDNSHHYIRQTTGREELFDYRDDARETRNIAADANAPVITAPLRRALEDRETRESPRR